MIEYLENKIKSCDELGGMEKEKWAFTQCLKHYRENSNQVQAVVMPNEVLAGGKTETEIRIDENNYWYNQFNNFQVAINPYMLNIFKERIKELEEARQREA